jgi:hypothetical protein
VTFTLRNAAGVQVSQATVPMDTFYAHTGTSIEVPLAALLVPGTYTVRLTLDDATQGVRADGTASFVVAASAAANAGGDQAVPGLTPVIQSAPPDAPPLLAIALAVILTGLGLGAAFGVLSLLVRRRRTRTSAR